MDAIGSDPVDDDPPDAIQGELFLGASLTPPRERNADRLLVSVRADLRQRGASAVAVDILDLSTHGFRVETHLKLDIGATLWLRLPGLEATPARVAWIEGNCAGCSFDRPLHAAVLAMIIDRSGGTRALP